MVSYNIQWYLWQDASRWPKSVAVCCRPAGIRPTSPGPVIRPAMQVRGPSLGCVKMCRSWKRSQLALPNFLVIADIADIAEMCFLEKKLNWHPFGRGEQNRPGQGNTSSSATSQGSRVPSFLCAVYVKMVQGLALQGCPEQSGFPKVKAEEDQPEKKAPNSPMYSPWTKSGELDHSLCYAPMH